MSYTKYTTKTPSKLVPTSKSDFTTLPFADIEHAYKEHYSNMVEAELSRQNDTALGIHERTVRRVLASRNASSEENPDDVPDFQPITELPVETLNEFKSIANEKAVLDFVEKHNITNSWSWLGPQIMSYLGNYTLPTKVDGFFRGTDFLKLNVTKAFDLGIYRMFTKVPRGRLMSQQTLPEHLLVCSLVPIYMAAQKRTKGTKFSEWNDIAVLVDKELLVAMNAPPLPGPYNAEELLSIRNTGLRYISKAKKELGVVKMHNPETYHMLTGISDSLVGGVNKYAKAMLCQFWCAHPHNRHKYMILDPYDWDNIPEPLIDTNVIRELPARTAFTAPNEEWMS